MDLVAYCDDINEFDWFVGLHPKFESAVFERIGRRGLNPEFVDDLIVYDRPDVILAIDQVPLLVIEKTREVPTGHNVGQRMARLVRAVEKGVPTIKFFPFEARKHGAYSSVCFLNARLLGAFERMWDIHNTPILAVNWPIDAHGELLDDESADSELIELIAGFVDAGLSGDCDVMQVARAYQVAEYQHRCALDARYAEPPPSLTIERTSEFIDRISLPDKEALAEGLILRDETVVYLIKMTEANCRREDPYTGTQFIYDYLYCRSGPDPADKARNLVLHFPSIRQEVWESNNPDDPGRKSCNWYLTANAHVYSDGWSLLR